MNRQAAGKVVCALFVSAWLGPQASAAAPNSGDTVQYANLLIPVEGTDDQLGPTGGLVVRSRAVRVDFDLLHSLRSAAGRSVALRLFDNVDVHLTVEGEFRVREDTYSLTGSVAGGGGGDFTVAFSPGRIAANVRLSGRRLFQIRPDRPGEYVLRQIDESRFPPCAGAVAPVRLPANAVPQRGNQDDGTVLDVLVLYTPAARAAVGSIGAMQAEIDLAVAESNAVFANTAIIPRLRLVHAAEIEYVESGDFGMDLAALSAVGDGELDEAHALRDAHCADLVSLFVANEPYPDGCGLAYIMTTPASAFASSAFSVVRADCAAGNLTFAHELGHNMGCHHDRGNACEETVCTSLCCAGDAGKEQALGAFTHSYGYRIPDRWRTVMAYPDGCAYCPQIPYFSNPALRYQGDALGVAGGHPNGADNARTINDTRMVVASFRASCPGACCSVGGGCSEVSEATCLAAGGFFQGNGTTCTPEACALGACCDSILYLCTDNVVEDDCQALQHLWSENTLCADLAPQCAPPVGRCCLDDGSCLATTSTDCFARSGRSGLVNTTCADDSNGDNTDDACELSILYYHHDATGNLLAKTDAAGQVVWRADVRPFGQGKATPADQPTRFLGAPRESDLGPGEGLYHLGARTYDPMVGRFISPDPLQLAATKRENPRRFARYPYALNNPYRFHDASGLQAVSFDEQQARGALRNFINFVEAKLGPNPTFHERLAAFVYGPVVPPDEIINTNNLPIRNAAGQEVDLDWGARLGGLAVAAAMQARPPFGSLTYDELAAIAKETKLVGYISAKAAWNTIDRVGEFFGGDRQTGPLSTQDPNTRGIDLIIDYIVYGGDIRDYFDPSQVPP